MPFYNLAKTGIVSACQQLVPGLPGYAFGSLNRLVAPTRMRISSVALSGTTATIVVLVLEGQIPTVGQLISISGAVPSYFNVTNASILSVSAAATPDIGVYTITFALTNSGIGTTVSPGLAIAPQVEIGDALAINNGSTATANSAASQAFSIQENVNPANGKTIRVSVRYPTMNGSATVSLQTSDLDIDSAYVTLGQVSSGANGGSVVFDGIEALFARLLIGSLAGTGNIVGTITI